MLAFSTLALFASVAMAASPSYKLKTHVLRGNTTFEGLYVHSFHTGAGSNAVTLDSGATTSPSGQLNGTYQEFTLGQYPYTFDLTGFAPYYLPTTSAPPSAIPPPGYNVVALNVGYNTPGFTVMSPAKALVRRDPAFRGFAACYVEGISPYFNVGPEVQLLWKNSTAGPPSKLCADIELRAVVV